MDQVPSLSPSKKRRAKHFSVEDKEQILNIYKVCSEHNPNNNKTENVAFTAKAAGICVSSVHKILKEYKNEHRLNPPKIYYRKRAILDNIDDLTKKKIRRLVHSFLEKNEQPTLNKILAVLHKEENMLHIKRTTLGILLKEIGLAKENNKMEYINISNNAENNKAHEENVTKEEVLQENETKYEFVDDIVKEEPNDSYDTIDIKSELQNNAFLYETANNEAHEENVIKVGVLEENEIKYVFVDVIVKEEPDDSFDTVDMKSELQNDASLYETANNEAHEENVIKVKVLEENKIKYKFVDDIVKDEPDDSYDTVDIKSELQNDAFLYETANNEESTSNIGPKSCAVQFNVNAHEQSNEIGRPFKCYECNKMFTYKSRLTTHMLIHTGEKPYKCDICNKAFKLRYYLVKHKRVHTRESPYKCDICDNAFNTKSNLVTHKRNHTGGKPFKCDICDKAFNQRSGLVRHKRCHTEKNF